MSGQIKTETDLPNVQKELVDNSYYYHVSKMTYIFQLDHIFINHYFFLFISELFILLYTLFHKEIRLKQYMHICLAQIYHYLNASLPQDTRPVPHVL